MSFRFLWQFFRDPRCIGAIAPSSAVLADTICSDIGLEQAAVVVEYGPGTGVFTAEILRRIRPGTTFCAIERNPEMVRILRQRFPEVPVYEDSVENVRAILGTLGVTHVDCVVCGLPWAAFDAELQDRLMDATLDVMRDGARFTTFAYLQGLLLPAGRRFRRYLWEHFDDVARSPIVWRNLPPAFAYRCTKRAATAARCTGS